MKSFGCDATVISSVGNDEDGSVILNEVKALGIKTDGIIQSDSFPTGVVQVTLDKSGSATYNINYPAAWDKIEINDFALNSVSHADVLIYGSLACRDAVSRKSLELLLRSDTYKVFDVNLRKPHYSYEILERLMLAADFIKFNDEEILEIATALQSPFITLEENIHFIASRTNTASICVTKGKDGALLLWEGELHKNEGYTVQIADTVGQEIRF